MTAPETNAIRRPQPLPGRDSAPFWEAASRGALVGQRCAGCGVFRHPPRPMCPHCRSLKSEWVPLSGCGKVAAHMRPVHPRIPMFDYPLVCVLVDLDEGIRLFSNLYDCAPESVENGMAVEVFFVPTSGDKQVPVFRPAGGGRS